MSIEKMLKSISKYMLKGVSHKEDMEEVIFWDKDKLIGNEICLQEIERIKNFCNEEEKVVIDKKILASLIKGIYGEKQTKRKLGYCDFYCNILSDIVLYDGNLKNQIDFLVITRKMCFIIECKNKTSTTKVLSDGRFAVGTYQNGKWKSEKISSPIEQNNEHVQLVKNIYKRNVNLISKMSGSKITSEYFKPVLVWVNNNSKIDWEDASEDVKEEVEEQFVYLERLVTYMNKIYNESYLPEKSIDEVEKMSRIFYEIHKEYEEEYYSKNKQRALREVLQVLTNVTPQEFLRRELIYYRESDFVDQVFKNGKIKHSYREGFLNQAMIEQIMQVLPRNIWELEDKIYNIGSYTRKHFGEDIIEIIDKYRDLLR